MYGIAKRTVLLLLFANIWSHQYYNIEKYRYKFKENGKRPAELWGEAAELRFKALRTGKALWAGKALKRG